MNARHAIARALQAIQAAEGWTESELAQALGATEYATRSWLTGRTGIGEANMLRVRTLLTRYAERKVA